MSLSNLMLPYDGVPMPANGETYADYLRRHNQLDRGFGFDELVKRTISDIRGRYRAPPPQHWHRMVPTLALANELRNAMRDGYPGNPVSASGLRVAAAYRPRGGAALSQHKRNAALDLDLLPSDYDLTQVYYETAVRLWCQYGKELAMGLGLYCSAKRTGGIRVHIDTGHRCRTWQISGRSLRPYTRRGKSVPLAYHLCDRLGLVPPTEQ